ncbi:helix-turn-helix domain-containing protein [Streptacidiphilus anmyonensis]|uniref:helix-turn-helix domain-containing protein n=1 Tax=Streptacidiphilus anmyonensis TaxID=405782 RepID=UPI000A73C4E9|nr:helix-turn-helix domain-containing protein [Streptacidiphilus anmyonensis]
MLEPIGLDDVEERAYELLVNRDALTVGSLAGLLDLGQARSRQALDGLIAAGLAVCRPGRPARYEPVDPRTGLTSLIRSRQAELERVTALVGAFAADYQERTLRTDPRLLVEVVEGPKEIARRVEELVSGAERDIVAFDAPPYVSPEGTSSQAEAVMLARGVKVRAIYANEVLAMPQHAERLREMVGLGEQARVLPRVPTKLIVVDGREAVLPLTRSDEGKRTVAAFVRQSGLSDALVELFEVNWATATPVFGSAGAHPRAEPDASEEDVTLLQLLNAGLKDEAIARHLGLSQRTFRRRIADLVQRLGATNRFQAGTQAMRRGWL